MSSRADYETQMQLFLHNFFLELEKNPHYTKEDIAKLKVRLCKKYTSIKKIPTDIELYLRAKSSFAKKYQHHLQTKPNNSLSGVTPVALMTSPHPCPHGKCRMCPGGVKSPWGDKPQSYTGAEPATMRAERAEFDAYLQVFNRLEQYVVTGHNPQKVDVIIMGGTFPARTKEYQDQFVCDVLNAMNTFSELFFSDGVLDLEAFKTFFELPDDIYCEDRIKKIHNKVLATKKQTSLEHEQEKNEFATIRCIGMTIETRPDWGYVQHGNSMLEQGATRVELGIQSVYDKALDAISRGHGSKESIQSIRQLRDLGFKLNFHMMLGLPGVSPQQDVEGLLQLFTNDAYRPDMIKIYPLLVLPGTQLEQDFKQGLYKPLTTPLAVDILAQVIPQIPNYCRVMRVQRDIPTYRIMVGVDKTNLRQYVDKEIQKRDKHPQEIRSRETGRVAPKQKPVFELVVTEYKASQGKEFFIAMEDIANNRIAGFCRLRFPSQQLREEITPTTALIRELHVYGAAKELNSGVGAQSLEQKNTKQGDVQVGSNKGFEIGSSQHKGFGKKLMKRAEEIAKENGYNHILVISGIGVRQYYKKYLGYFQQGPYVGKKI
ncbi:MAG: tRNA uridine(34) 5-carboxymethylaminomethyl modification radical SAM/GNAT enzyme Elp3 [Candidatus Nanoarchaeia archaeon]